MTLRSNIANRQTQECAQSVSNDQFSLDYLHQKSYPEDWALY